MGCYAQEGGFPEQIEVLCDDYLDYYMNNNNNNKNNKTNTNMAYKISKNFTLEEMYSSASAQRYGINNTPSADIQRHLVELVSNILQPLRDAWGDSIRVTSGYRCPELNKKVGGSSTSAHVSGYAADLQPTNGNITEFKAFVMNFLKDKNFDQYINEFSGNSQWVHIGIRNREGKQRKQYLMYKNGKYTTIK